MSPPVRWRLVALPLALVLGACAGPETRPDTSSVALPEVVEAPAATVAEAFLTAPLRQHEIDSVAAWNTPDGDT